MATSILGGISQETTQQELLTEAIYYLAAILEKMPRVTGQDQMAVAIETGTLGTLTTLTTCSTVTTVGNQNQMGSKYVSGDNFNLAGTQHIYNNIKVV